MRFLFARTVIPLNQLAQLPDQVQKSWFEFDHYYSDNAFPEVLPIVFANKPKRLLDVGGNTGKTSKIIQ